MAGERIVLGLVKTAVKTAMKSLAKESLSKKILSTEAKKALINLSKGQISDTVALTVDRAKSTGKTELYKLIEHETGLPISDAKKLVKTFHQTEKMKDLSLGQNFKNIAQSVYRKEIGTTPNDKINQITRKIKKFNKETEAKKPLDNNSMIKLLLTEIENEFFEKTVGVTNSRKNLTFKVNVSRFYKPSNKYNKDNVISLEEILKNITSDFLYYETGSGEEMDIHFDEEFSEYDLYSKKSIEKAITKIETDVKIALVIV